MLPPFPPSPQGWSRARSRRFYIRLMSTLAPRDGERPTRGGGVTRENVVLRRPRSFWGAAMPRSTHDFRASRRLLSRFSPKIQAARRPANTENRGVEWDWRTQINNILRENGGASTLAGSETFQASDLQIRESRYGPFSTVHVRIRISFYYFHTFPLCLVWGACPHKYPDVLLCLSRRRRDGA